MLETIQLQTRAACGYLAAGKNSLAP